MDPTVTVRPAHPDDIPTLFVMKWQLALAERATHTVRASEADWQRDMFGPQAKFSALLAEQDATAIGMVTLTEHYAPGWIGPTLYVNDLYVVPARRRAGVGRALIAAAAAEAARCGAAFLELAVRQDNPARRLYRRIGFERLRGAETYILAGQNLRDACRTHDPEKLPAFQTRSCDDARTDAPAPGIVKIAKAR
jgi:ribosomal protein S18 acetylase RimI-like enzyme